MPTPFACVTCCSGPFGACATPKSMPAFLNPVVAHGPQKYMASFWLSNSLSISPPVKTSGPNFLSRIFSAHLVMVSTFSGLLKTAFPSFMKSPPFPHSMIHHIGVVSLTAMSKPYFPVFSTICSAYCSSSSQVAGGVSGSNPASVKIVLL